MEGQISTGGNIRNEIESKQNFLQRIGGMIFSPSKTIRCLIEKPRILFPFLSSAFSLLILYLLRYELYEDYIRTTLEKAAAVDTSITSEQIEALIGMSATMGLALIPITSVIIWLVSSAILFGISKLFKGEGHFKQYLSIVGYCGVITLLYYLISFIVSFLNGELLVDASLANVTNLFAPYLKDSFFYGIIKGIDFFSIWYFILVAMGITMVSKLSKMKVYSMVTLIFIAQLLINANELRYM